MICSIRLKKDNENKEREQTIRWPNGSIRLVWKKSFLKYYDDLSFDICCVFLISLEVGL